MRYVDLVKRMATPGLCLTAVVIVMATAPASAALVGYWKLDETAGTTAADSSGNNHNGALIDGPMWDAAGYFDGTISLDGLNDRIHVPYHTDLTYTGGNLTLSTWVYLNAGETLARLISKPWHGSGQYNYVLMVSGTSAVFSLANPAIPGGNLQNVGLTSSSGVLSQEGWHHIAAVADSASNMSVYVNGNVVGARTSTITDWTGTDSHTALALGTLYPYSAGWAGRTDFCFGRQA